MENLVREAKQYSKRAMLYALSKLLWVIILFGVVVRLVQYASNRSLWVDEANLALNITNRSFSALLEPLEYFQGAPVGFLELQKLAVSLFGSSEYVLRLFPFLSGIISLFLFCMMARKYVNRQAVLVSVGLFALSSPLIYYSSEVKQYSSDVLFTLILYLTLNSICSKKVTVFCVFLLGFIGVIVIWFSHPSVFILAGVGISMFAFSLYKREWARSGSLSIVYSVWGLSFLACYFVSLRSLANNEVLLAGWSHKFLPFPPSTIPQVKSYINSILSLFDFSLETRLPGIVALAFVVGLVSIFLRRKEDFFTLIAPVVLTFIASCMGKYPFGERLSLFLAPVLIIFVAEGAVQILDKSRNRSATIGIALMVLIFLNPIYYAGFHLVRPFKNEEIKPVMGYVREQWQDDDLLYVYYGSIPAFTFYSESYGFNGKHCVRGVKSRGIWENYKMDLDKLRGCKRVWIIFSHVYDWEGVDEEKLFLYFLDSMGTMKKYFKSHDASGYLYDLKGEQEKGGIDRWEGCENREGKRE